MGEQEYVVEQQPYPNLPVYVVYPRGGGCSWTLQRNYLLPISNNLDQEGDENSVVGVEPIDKPTPVQPADNGLPADGLTESQPENLLILLTKQHKAVDLELTRLTAPVMTSVESQAGQDQPVPLGQSGHTMRNQLPCRYQNFAPQ